MTTTLITNEAALQMVAANQAVLVDVREPAEYWEGHLAEAINLPSTRFEIETYREFEDKAICLICQTGNRAGQIAGKLRQHGLHHVFLLEQQMINLSQAEILTAPSAGWSIDRQFRMTLGLLLLTFFLGYFFWSELFIVIPMVICAGLIITSIIDRCYLRVWIAMLPWNRNRHNGSGVHRIQT